MGFSDFWLQFNNGKKEQLKASLSSVKKEQVDKKFENLFNIFDVNKDGALDEAELKNIESQLEIFAGEDKVLNPSENSAAASIFANDLNTEEADFMGFVKSVSDASNEVSMSSKFDFKEQQFYQTLSNIMASNGRVKYDTRLVAEMFKQIENGQAGWTRKGNTFSNGTANDITITEVSSIRYDKGVLDIKNGQERFYRVSAYSNQDNILTEYVFDQNGSFQYKEISNKHNPNLAQKICPDGTSYLDEYENGRLISRQIKNQDGNTTEILNLEYENNKIKESVKIYTEFSSDAERRNKMVVELNTGEYQILEKDSQGKYTKIIESSINDSIPILDEKGNITRYQPVTQYIMKFDEKGKSYLHHTNTIDLEEIENNLAPNEHCDYSQIDKEINETIVNTMKINLQTTIELLKNWNSQKSYLDASAILDKITLVWGGDINSFIAKMENDLKKVETMEKTTNKAEFAKLYCELTGVREFNTTEKQKWLDISTDLAKLNMTGLADTSDINTYIQCTAIGLKDTRFISTLNNAKGSLNDLETTGVAIDILGMVLEFKAIGVAINWFLKGTKWLFNATKGARIAKYVSTAGEYLKSEREVAKILNACATRVNNSLVSGLNFATYDALHEYGRQLHNNEKFNETSVLEAAWHGSKLGFTSSMLSSIIAPQVMKLFKNKQDFAKIEEAIENCFKKGKTSGEEIAKAVASAQAEMGLAAKATNFVLEVGTFTAAASTIDLHDGKNIKDIVRQNNINNLTEEQIDNLTTTGLMKAVLDAQGNDTSQMSDLEIWENYAISQYKEQFVGLGQIKLAENVIGMFLTKGKLPVNGKYGARVKALELEYDQNGKPYLKSDPNKKILSSEELAGMTYKAMAYDALEARLTNRFNEYKNKPMNGKEFIDAAIGKHDYCPADDLNIRVTEDGKFEVSDVNTKIETVVVGSIEEVLALQQMYNTTEAVKQMFLAETQGVNEGVKDGVKPTEDIAVKAGVKPSVNEIERADYSLSDKHFKGKNNAENAHSETDSEADAHAQAIKFEKVIAEISNQRIRDILCDRLNRLEKIHAPEVIVENEKALLLGRVQMCKNLLDLVERIKDNNTKQEITEKIEAKITELLNEKEQSLSSSYSNVLVKSMRNIIKNAITGDADKFRLFLITERPEIYEEIIKKDLDINNLDFYELKKDFEILERFGEDIKYCKNNPNSQKSEEIYEEYLQNAFVSDNPKISDAIKDRCRQINREFGVKVFLPSNLKEAGVALKLVYQELFNFKIFAQNHGEEAKMPPTLNFLQTQREYINKNAVGLYSQNGGTISIKGLTIEQIKHALRHELIHANDKTDTTDFPEGFDPTEYVDDLLEAGVTPSSIVHGLENRREFIATAAEGDMRLYWEQFKKVLLELGMPEWVLDMQNFNAHEHIINKGLTRLSVSMDILLEYDKIKNDKSVDTQQKGTDYSIRSDKSEIENPYEQSSHIEIHFETIAPDAAEKVIYNSIIHNSEENVEKFHGHIYPKSLLRYCEIDGKVSKELVDIGSELLLKFSLGSDYKVMTIMDLFKTKSGIDRLAIKKFKELSTGDYEKYEEIAMKLKSCKDSQGRFREDYYSKLQQIRSPEDKYAYWILDECKVNGDIDERIWAKALELQSLGFSTSDIRSLISCCRSTHSNFEIDNFSDELYQKVLDLKQHHNIPNGEIYQIIDKCKTKDGAFNEEKYNFAIELSSHIDNDIANSADWLIRCENKEELFNRLDEMKNKYGIKDDYQRFYELSCDIIQDGKVVDDTPWNAEYTLRFNKDKFKRVMNLASELKIRSFQLQTLIKYCYKNGKFDEATYNTILNLYRAGMTDGFDLQQIIGDCIYKRDRGDTSIVNHKLMEKLAQWFTSYVEIKSAQEPNKDINIIKNNARNFVQRMIGKINNTECEATEYIQKFIDVGLIDNIGEILEVASIKDNKANDSFQEPEKHYDKKVMDRMLSLQNKYKLDSEDVNKAINYLKNNYKVENLTTEEKITYFESLDKLFDASGSPKDLLEQIKKAELTFELNMIVTPECLDSYTKYMKQGVDFKTIDIVENFSCPEKYKDNPDVFIDKVLSFINSLPEEMQKYPRTLCHLEEWADIITETVKQNNNEQFIKEYMHMLQYQIATFELENPEFRQNVIHILECAKEHPDKLREIETVLIKSEGDFEIQKVCLKYPDRYQEILDAQKWLTLEDANGNKVYNISEMAKSLIIQFNKAGMPIDDILRVTDKLRSAQNVQHSSPMPEKLVEKIVELYNNKKLDNTTLNIIVNIPYTNISVEVFDYISGLINSRKLVPDEAILSKIGDAIRTPINYIYENYKEIVDFIINSRKTVKELQPKLSIEEQEISNCLLEACKYHITNRGENVYKTEYFCNVDLMQKVFDYVNQGIIPLETFKNYCYTYSGYKYENLKAFIEFLDKIDLEKYKDEVNLILEHCNPKNAATNPNLTKESWEFILDVQKLLIENKTEQQDEPEVINSGFLNIFRDGKIPDEVLNRLQFYIESSISNPDVFDVAGFSVKIAKDLVELCTLRPDKIVLFEDILYNSHLSNEYVLDRFSKSKDVLDKQLELYDIFNDYSKLYYLIKNDESVGDVEAKIEIYQCQSKYKKPLLNRIGNNDKTLMSILSDTREYNKDIIKTAIAQGQKLDIIKSLAFHSTKENVSFILELMNTKDYDIEYINALAIKIRVKTQVDFAQKLIEQGGFSIKQIIYIAHSVQGERERVELAELLCFDKKLNFPKEYIADIVDATNPKYLDFTKKLCYDKEIDPKYISQIVKFVTSDEQLEIAEELLSTKDFKNWTCRNIDNGLDINTIYSLSKTQSKIYHEINQAQKAVEDKAKKEAARIAQEQASKKTQTVQADPRALEEITEALVRTGVNENRAKGDYAKVCVDSNGNVDKEKLEAACALIKAFGFTYSIKKKTGERVSNPNISSKDIADIFKYTIGNHMSAQNGVFRPEIIKDIITLKKAGIDDVKFIANLAYIKNMGLIEMKARLSGEERRGVASRIEALSGDVIESAKRLGIDIDAIKEKAQTSDKKISNLKIKEGIPAASIEVRTLDSIVGTERVVLNKFKDKVPQEIWQDKAAFHQWALEQITGKKDADGNIAEEGIYNPETGKIRFDLLAKDNYADYNYARIRGIKEWYEFLNSDESNVKDDIFAQLLFLDGMTKDMKPNNAVTPPDISHETFEQVYNTLLEDNTTVSVTKKYNEINRNKAVEQYGKETVVDGIKGRWVRIPSGGKRGEPEYDEHIAMVQALSEGSSWCLRFENAHTYLANGDLYFFVTKKNDGSYESQVAINMNKNNQITQIQKRYNQDSTVPIPYAKVIDEWRRDENGNIRFEGLNNKIQEALDAKPEFDRQKAEFSKILESGDYKGLFSALGIKCKIARDGTFVLDKYSAFVPKTKYTLYDLGIDENQLMQKVSYITGTIDIKASAITALPSLKEVGDINFDNGNSSISGLSSLEKIGECNVYWDKKDKN